MYDKQNNVRTSKIFNDIRPVGKVGFGKKIPALLVDCKSAKRFRGTVQTKIGLLLIFFL